MRSQLHTKTVMSWLKQKYPLTTKEKYKFFPEELLQRQELENLFNKFDKDQSNALDFDEVLEMFHKYGFFIKQEELMEYFRIVDLNRDLSLNLEEFKACMLDEKAKKCFTQIMKQLQRRTNQTQDIELVMEKMNQLEPDQEQNEEFTTINPSPVLPLSFQKLINLLTYLNQRDELKEIISKPDGNINQQFKTLKQIIELSSVIDLKKNAHKKPPHSHRGTTSLNVEQINKELHQLKKNAVQRGMNQAEGLLKRTYSRQIFKFDHINEQLENPKLEKNKFNKLKVKCKTQSTLFQTKRIEELEQTNSIFKNQKINVNLKMQFSDYNFDSSSPSRYRSQLMAKTNSTSSKFTSQYSIVQIKYLLCIKSIHL